MSKTRRNYTDDRYFDGDDGYSYEEYKNHKKEKRVARALKTMNIDELLDLEEANNWRTGGTT